MNVKQSEYTRWDLGRVREKAIECTGGNRVRPVGRFWFIFSGSIWMVNVARKKNEQKNDGTLATKIGNE